MKKLFSLLLCLTVILTCVALPTNAAVNLDETVSPMYNYTSSVDSQLTITSKTATCKSIITGISGTTTKIEITQRLQKKNGDSWTNVQSWTKTVTTYVAVFTNTKSSLASGTYRTRTIAKVYKGTAYETIYKNSTTVTI